MYSQNKEELYILDFFKDKIGTFLDIGAYDGVTFSNTRQLVLNGWKGVCVEPSKLVFPKLVELYKDSEQVEVVNVAIAQYNGSLSFWDSAGAVATSYQEHYDKWKNDQKDFELIEVPCVTFTSFYKSFPYKYDFINIDAEGLDARILTQIDLNKTATSLICIEYTYESNKIMDYLDSFGFKNVLYTNGENIVISR